MKSSFLLISLSFLCVACGVTRKATPSETVRVETHVETIYQTDTVLIERPQIIERIQTMDTISVLDNKYAHSEASVSAGVLTHVLETKQMKEPVAVQSKIVYRDSLVYLDRYIIDEVPVPAKITKWQRLRMDIGSITLAIVILALIYMCTKYIVKFIIH